MPTRQPCHRCKRHVKSRFDGMRALPDSRPCRRRTGDAVASSPKPQARCCCSVGRQCALYGIRPTGIFLRAHGTPPEPGGSFDSRDSLPPPEGSSTDRLKRQGERGPPPSPVRSFLFSSGRLGLLLRHVLLGTRLRAREPAGCNLPSCPRTAPRPAPATRAATACCAGSRATKRQRRRRPAAPRRTRRRAQRYQACAR